jgi:hypothetical protein
MTARKTKKKGKKIPHPCLPGCEHMRQTQIAKNQTVIYQLQTYESLQAVLRLTQSYLENAKMVWPKSNHQNDQTKGFPGKRRQ